MTGRKVYRNLKQYRPTETDHTMQLVSPPPRRSMDRTTISRRSRSVGMDNSSVFSRNLAWLPKATSTPKQESSGPFVDSMRLQFHYGETLTEMNFNKDADPKYRLGPIFVNGEKYVKERETEPSLLITTPKLLTFDSVGCYRRLTLFNTSESYLAVEVRGIGAKEYDLTAKEAIMKPASLLKISIRRSSDDPNETKLLAKFVAVSNQLTDVQLAFSKMPGNSQHGEVEVTLKSI